MLVMRKTRECGGWRRRLPDRRGFRILSVSGVVGFLGFGNMGQAIAKGLVKAEAIAPDQLAAYDLDREKAAVAVSLGGRAADSPGDLARSSRTLVLAPKPQDMATALESIRDGLRDETLIISIAAGISTEFIQRTLDRAVRVARVMPNTPALAGAGASGIALSANCTPNDGVVARAIFEAVGLAEEVPEDAMDAVTALSGSGPAYYFAFVEACVGAAVGLGLNEDQATRLAGQTLYGAGLLLKESGETAAVLRERVTSKGGTTAAALAVFEERDLNGTVRAAMDAAARRSRELGQ